MATAKKKAAASGAAKAPKAKKAAGGAGTSKAVKARKSPAKGAAQDRKLNARPDSMDFRDLMYVPSLVEVPTRIPLSSYKRWNVPVLDQGREGACTGFGLATVAHYLLRRRAVVPDDVPVSPRMFYENARRYDEWPGEDYDGSSARGAMKGWHKHGVCAESDWPYLPGQDGLGGLTTDRATAGLARPLGAYFRVNHKDLIAMHAAIAEVGVLYATATVHEGWNAVGADGEIVQSDRITGGHAFAIVAFDEKGFWIQNSWGPGWGRRGLGRISYDDWLDNGSDVWVARLGAPVELHSASSIARTHAAGAAQSEAYSYAELRPHIVSVGNDGALYQGGDYGTTEAELARRFQQDIPDAMASWPVKRVLLYAHGGLTDEKSAAQRLAEYRPTLLASGVYPLAFVWHSDFWSTLTYALQDAVRRRRPEGFLDAAKDFMLDRLDDALEPLARLGSGKLQWDQMKQNALAASDKGRAARLVADHLAALAQAVKGLEIHVVGHSAGAVFHARLIEYLTTALGLKIRTCTLWAPACTVALFNQYYLPAISKGRIERFTNFVLSDKAEQDDDCARLYNKSLLYLVSNAFEEKARIPLLRDGVPLLGMQKFIDRDAALKQLFTSGKAELVIAPNNAPPGSPGASEARHHGDFDDDEDTVRATFARMVTPSGATKGAAAAAVDAAEVAQADFSFQRSASSLRDKRSSIDAQTQQRVTWPRR